MRLGFLCCLLLRSRGYPGFENFRLLFSAVVLELYQVQTGILQPMHAILEDLHTQKTDQTGLNTL